MTEKTLAQAKQEFLDNLRQAERSAYQYFVMCPVGAERIWAADVYERVRTATLRLQAQPVRSIFIMNDDDVDTFTDFDDEDDN